MAPNQNGTENDATLVNRSKKEFVRDYPNANPYDTKAGEKPYKLEIVWRNVFLFLYLHIACVACVFYPVSGKVILFGFAYGFISSYGISAGAHRYWAHKCYKVTRPLYFILLFLQTIALQNCVIEWVRDHRVHHKYSDTNADPHNASRGFFFSHMGWLMCKKHPDVFKYGKRIDMTDLTSDPILRFQKKYYVPLVLFCTFALPITISMYFFNTPFWYAYHWHILRYVVSLHITWSINSVSHIWGSKPFEKDIKPTDTYAIGFMAFGEGWHNYHHVYPFDYKVSELPRYWCNFTIPFIDFFAWLGWAYDLKTVSDDMIRRRVLRTGDGSHRHSKEAAKQKTQNELIEEENNNINEEEEERLKQNVARIRDHYWGWGDSDMLEEDINDIRTVNPKTCAE
ncbi:Acyl-CoA Delta-9 desaturase [Pseudolycoriella hygida]|uniref:Acyl-CoA Delta-9 desaturase n=1 Tax=Pseudolycoriella hygida TaxID=35572 RepID=A0A9Q0RZ74_9DIPT|nr:Acyl-CoA Delta-9 desaturase [Pseudolycoriella hygida]